MKHRSLTTLLLALSPLVSTGCNPGESSAGRAVSGPPADSYVYVQFRRDLLGVAATTGTSPTAEGMGASGTLKEANAEFIVLKVDNEAGRELWIPRSSILMMDVRPTK